MDRFFGPPRYNARRRHGGGNDVVAVMLIGQLLRQIDRLPVKPPVTLGVMALLGAIYFFPDEFGMRDPHDWAFQPYLIYEQGQWARLWFSPLVHAHIWHLYYNLTSFLYKGVSLESTFGTPNFAIVVLVVTVLTQMIFLIISVVLHETEMNHSAMFTYTVGFSGTIFGLKVILNALEEGVTGFGFDRILSLDLPWSKVVWVELFVAQLSNPEASFLGHLSGILAGIIITPLLPLLLNSPDLSRFFRRRSRFWGSGRASQTSFQNERGDNHQYPAHSRPFPDQFSDHQYISPEELRQRRLERLYGGQDVENDHLRQRRTNHWS